MVEALSDHLDVVYVELPARRDGMMVCAPRDVCLLRWWGRSVDGSSSYVVCSSVVHSACPPRRGVVRVTEWESSMRIEKSGVGSVVLQTLEWSPAGWLGAVGAWAGLVSDDLLAALPRAQQQRRGMVEETAAKGSVVTALPPSDVEPYAERAVLEALRRRRPSDAINAISGAGPLPWRELGGWRPTARGRSAALCDVGGVYLVAVPPVAGDDEGRKWPFLHERDGGGDVRGGGDFRLLLNVRVPWRGGAAVHVAVALGVSAARAEQQPASMLLLQRFVNEKPTPPLTLVLLPSVLRGGWALRQGIGEVELDGGFEQRQVGGESFVEVAYGLAEDGRGMQLREAIDVLVDAGAATADAKVRLGLALRSRVSEGGPLVLLAELDLEIGVLLRAARLGV